MKKTPFFGSSVFRLHLCDGNGYSGLTIGLSLPTSALHTHGTVDMYTCIYIYIHMYQESLEIDATKTSLCTVYT